MYCRKYLTGNCKKVYVLGIIETMKSGLEDVHGHKETHKPEKNISWRTERSQRRRVKEIKKKLQENQTSHLSDSEGEQLEQLCTMDAGEQKQNSTWTTEKEKENHQERNNNSKL